MENKFCLKSKKELDEIREAKKQVNEISDKLVGRTGRKIDQQYYQAKGKEIEAADAVSRGTGDMGTLIKASQKADNKLARANRFWKLADKRKARKQVGESKINEGVHGVKILKNTLEEIELLVEFDNGKEDTEYYVKCYLVGDDTDTYSIRVYDGLHHDVNPHNDNEVMNGLFDSDGGSFDGMEVEIRENDYNFDHMGELEDLILDVLFNERNGIITKYQEEFSNRLTESKINEISDETVYNAVAKAQDRVLKSLRKDPDKRNFLRDADKLNNIYNTGLRREWRKKGLKNPVGMSAKQLGKVWDKDYEPVKNEYERQLKKRHKVDAFGNDKKQVDEGAGSAVIFEFEKADFNIPRVEDKQVIAEVEDLTLASAYDRREAPNGGFIVFDLDQVKAATVKTYNVNDRLVDEPELAVEDIADVKYVSVETMPNLSYSWGWSRIELPKDVVLTWDKYQANYYMPELEVIFTDKAGEEYRVNSVNVDGEYHISEDVYYAYQDLDNYEDEEYDESLTAEKALAKSKTILEEYDESLAEAKVKPETLKAQLEEEIKKFFKYEPDALDWAFVEITKEEGRTRVEVRAELDYNGMWALSDALDPVVQKYDEDAYFEQEQPCIMTAYIENKKGLGERKTHSHHRKSIAEAKSKKMPKGELVLKLVHQVTKNDKGESAHVKYDWDKKEYNIEDQETGEILVSGKPNDIIKWAESKGAKQPAKDPGFAIDGAETLDQVYIKNWNKAMSKMAKNESAETRWGYDGHGYVEIEIPVDYIHSIAQSGDNAEAVKEALNDPFIANQFKDYSDEAIEKCFDSLGFDMTDAEVDSLTRREKEEYILWDFAWHLLDDDMDESKINENNDLVKALETMYPKAKITHNNQCIDVEDENGEVIVSGDYKVIGQHIADNRAKMESKINESAESNWEQHDSGLVLADQYIQLIMPIDIEGMELDLVAWIFRNKENAKAKYGFELFVDAGADSTIIDDGNYNTVSEVIADCLSAIKEFDERNKTDIIYDVKPLEPNEADIAFLENEPEVE